MNVELLKEIRDEVLAYPESMDMDKVFSDCGTAGCIAGHALHHKYRKALNPRIKKFRVNGLIGPSMWEAAIYLGLGEVGENISPMAKRLFLLAAHCVDPSSRWPIELENDYKKATTPKQRARVVAKRINRFIKTKGAV